MPSGRDDAARERRCGLARLFVLLCEGRERPGALRWSRKDDMAKIKFELETVEKHYVKGETHDVREEHVRSQHLLAAGGEQACQHGGHRKTR